MNKSSVQKCRTCLKSSANTFALTKLVTGCSPEKTYGQLLEECVKLECTTEYEHLMPQYICPLCCRELKNAYAFIKQAQICNNKLLHVITKKLECLQEKIIDVPENQSELKVSSNIRVNEIVSNFTTNEQKHQNIETRNESSSEELEESEANEATHNEEDAEEVDTSSTNEVIELVDMSLEAPETVSNANEFEIYTEESQEVVSCPICEKNISNHDDLNIHMRSHHDIHGADNLIHKQTLEVKKVFDCEYTEESQAVVSCPICEKNISNHDDLNMHMRSHHDIHRADNLIHKQRLEVKKVFDCKQKLEARKTFNCKLCPSKYSNRYSYTYHLKRKHNIDEKQRKEKLKAKIIKCRSCDYTARTYAALTYHNRAKHGTDNDKFKCKFCNYSSIKKFDLLTHVRNVHKELIKTLKADAENNGEIREASSKAKTPSELEPLEENNSEEFSSDDDIPLARRTNNLKANMKEDEEQFSDEDFIRSILNIKKRHNKPSTTSLARRCDECGNVYKNYTALYTHQKHVHISEDKYSLCPHCGKKYKRKTDLRIHVEKNHIPKNSDETAKQPSKVVREKRFMCTECSYVCTTITILNIHINRKHTGERPYKCDICFKSFLIPYDLKIHRYLHTGERPYKCPICSKGFRDNSHMMKHKRTHSTERPFKCKECGKGFALPYYLSVHNRTHLKEKKLNCITCGKVFENRSLLNLHRINEDHQDEIV